MFESIRDLFRFIKGRKAWWLLPVILALLLVGLIIILGSSPAIAPFIYSIF